MNALKSDGTCYRRWSVVVETAGSECLSLVAPVGSRIWDIRGEWIQEYAMRAYCWPEQPYILNEVYGPNGELAMVYVNINSPIEISSSHPHYTHYELDAVLRPPYRARIVYEDEFAEAAKQYCYSEGFQRRCYEAASRGTGLAECWVPRGAPGVM